MIVQNIFRHCLIVCDAHRIETKGCVLLLNLEVKMAAPVVSLVVVSIGIGCTTLIILAVAMDTINRRRYESIRAAKQDDTQRNDEHTGGFVLPLLTNIAMIVFVLHTTSVSLARVGVYPSNHSFCTWLVRINISLFHIARCSLFAVLICRIHLSFRDSTFAYSSKYVYFPLYFIIFCWMVFALIHDVTLETVSGHFDAVIQSCVPRFPAWGIALSASIDLVLCVISLILFIAPLIKLNKLQNAEYSIEMEQHHIETDSPASAGSVSRVSSLKAKRDTKLGALIIRYALLAMIAIGSTFALYIVTFFAVRGATDIAVPIDNVVNVWCIILIHKANRSVYKKACFSCHGAIKKCLR